MKTNSTATFPFEQPPPALSSNADLNRKVEHKSEESIWKEFVAPYNGRDIFDASTIEQLSATTAEPQEESVGEWSDISMDDLDEDIYDPFF